MENLKDIESGGYLSVLVITAEPAHKLRSLDVLEAFLDNHALFENIF